MNKSDKILDWLRSHPLINLNAFCKVVGYSRQSLNYALNRERAIPEHHFEKFEEVLKEYGYKA